MTENAPPVVYLDLNHWVHLAQARVGHREGAAYVPALGLLRKVVADGRAVIPLSSAHYDEVRKIKAFDRRNELALTMAELSGYRTLVNRAVMRTAELKRSLASQFGLKGDLELPPVVGYGFVHAYGQGPDTWHIDGVDLISKEELGMATPRIIAELERHIGGGWHFQSTIADPSRRFAAACDELLQFIQLRGPRPGAEEQELRTRYGYKPEELQNLIQEDVERQQRIVAELEKRPNEKRRYEDLLGAYAYAWELVGDLIPALEAVDHTFDDLATQGKEAMAAVLERMPTIQTDAALRGGNLHNLERHWEPNDIYDLEHLSVSAAYCDVVVTEKHAATLLNRAGIGERFGTVITSRIDDLLACLYTLDRS